MGKAKNIVVDFISSADARRAVKTHHYSGKTVNNSQVHLGVFYEGRLEGAMQFGPSMDKRKMQGLVSGTSWHGFIELNRLAFSERLPRNAESRALAVAFRLFRKHYQQIEWIVSFADATQCGDGTIYRASGFLLTGLKKNTQVWEAPTSETFSRTSLTDGRCKQQQQAKAIISRTTATKGGHILSTGAASMRQYIEAGWKPKEGFQIRYVYFLNPKAKERLTVPVLPFSAIDEAGAGMYKGVRRDKQAMSGDHPEQRRGSTDHSAPSEQLDPKTDRAPVRVVEGGGRLVEATETED